MILPQTKIEQWQNTINPSRLQALSKCRKQCCETKKDVHPRTTKILHRARSLMSTPELYVSLAPCKSPNQDNGSSVSLKAILDTQATSNFIGIDIVQDLGLKIHAVTQDFLLLDGSTVYSLGRVYVDCTIANLNLHWMPVPMEVLKDSSRSVIMGQGSIRAIYQSLGYRPLAGPMYRPMTISVENGLARQIVKALPDSGATCNLISSRLIRGFGVVSTTGKHRFSVALSCGRIVHALGTAVLRYSFCGAASQLGSMVSRFVILKDPPFDLILGSDTAFWPEVLNRYADLFEWSPRDLHPSLFCGVGVCEDPAKRSGDSPVYQQSMYDQITIWEARNQDEIQRRDEARRNAQAEFIAGVPEEIRSLEGCIEFDEQRLAVLVVERRTTHAEARRKIDAEMITRNRNLENSRRRLSMLRRTVPHTPKPSFGGIAAPVVPVPAIPNPFSVTGIEPPRRRRRWPWRY